MQRQFEYCFPWFAKWGGGGECIKKKSRKSLTLKTPCFVVSLISSVVHQTHKYAACQTRPYIQVVKFWESVPGRRLHKKTGWSLVNISTWQNKQTRLKTKQTAVGLNQYFLFFAFCPACAVPTARKTQQLRTEVIISLCLKKQGWKCSSF